MVSLHARTGKSRRQPQLPRVELELVDGRLFAKTTCFVFGISLTRCDTFVTASEGDFWHYGTHDQKYRNCFSRVGLSQILPLKYR